MKTLKFFCVITLFTLLACDSMSDVEVDLPAQEQKLVVQSFISPQDTLIAVSVTLSQPIFNNPNSNEFPFVENATVRISDGVVIKTLTLSNSNNEYNNLYNFYIVKTSEFPVVAGKIYYLTVTTPDGKSVTANTTIPAANKTLTCSYSETSNEYTDMIVAQWNDPAGIENYYQICYTYKINNGYDTVYSDYPMSVDYTDRNSDGMLLTKRIEISEGYDSSELGGKISLLHTSKEYYLYHSSVRASMNLGGNPFAENVQVYSNIEGGYGVFAGFNSYELIVVP